MMLERMREIMNKIPRRQFILEKAKSRAEKCTQGFNQAVSGGVPQDISEKVFDIMKCEQALADLREELRKDREIVEPIISGLPDAKQRAAARLRYIDGYSVTSIALEMGFSDRHMYRIMKSAEKNIEEILKCH